jgi:hypothetical protein
MPFDDLQTNALPFVPDRATALDALRLIDDHGDLAALAAKAEADRSRNAGNIVSFCRWRQIGRLIAALEPGGEQTRH